MSRRRMLATSAGALVATSMIRAAKAATQTDIGDKTPHASFNLAGKTGLVTGAARGISQAICVPLAAGADVIMKPADDITVITFPRGSY